MKLSERIRNIEINGKESAPSIVQAERSEISDEVALLEASLASASAIMQKFVDKVDRGMARSIETYAEMKQWMEDE